MVEMRVEAVAHVSRRRQAALLRERDGQRTAQVVVGPGTASWLAAHLAHVPLARPGTHLIALGALARLGGRLRQTVVDRGPAGAPCAFLELDTAAGLVEVGCGPEDAVAFAAAAGVGVLLHPDLLALGTAAPSAPEPRAPADRAKPADPGPATAPGPAGAGPPG